jgi:hypothetical protein
MWKIYGKVGEKELTKCGKNFFARQNFRFFRSSAGFQQKSGKLKFSRLWKTRKKAVFYPEFPIFPQVSEKQISTT